MAKVTRLSETARALERKKAKDYDPEDDAFDNSDEEQSDGDNEPTPIGGREHYETVGKSTLRQSEKTALDAAKYGGVAISRKALEDQGSDGDANEDEDDPFAPADEGDDDDPFAKRGGSVSGSEDSSSASALDLDDEGELDENDEIDSDEALGESDEEKFKNFVFRGSKKNRKEPTSSQEESRQESSQVSSEDEGSDSASIDSEMDGSDLDMLDAEDSEDDDEESLASSNSSSPPPKSTRPARNSEREELRKAALLSTSSANLASALSAGATADAKKGQAVIKQQQAFDRILDARIKLQKGLTAANDLSKSTLSDEQVASAARQAEDAALKLWSTINTIRYELISSRPSTSKEDGTKSLKRKRPSPISPSTSSSSIWQELCSLDTQSHSYDRAALDKWHARTQPAIDASARSKLLGRQSQPQSRLTDVLTTYLTTTSANLISTSTANNALYDDSPFYQSLLRDLIASKSNSDQSLAMSVDSYLPIKLHASGSRNKKVDTKASKGRKIRYTVHEKLQNFMAPEDRTSWEDGAATEFFASLLGRTAVLDENEDEDGEDSDGDGNGLDHGSEEVALRLFRS
ncbi:hypothetical protein PV10_06422 [Exophiala mesophila]|uniref:Protein BFR2 n=1 Tax=Exophiala mesophila TaxID=212818 RepID=A0A0D1XUP7_EXOME|nr:uncharacterized protein PV10_06422 [Exophiala mesophila]KIV91936.1 hypothetical protein PV10_06422 [Exophiala mesophila]